MSNIEQYLADILAARYGEEVRQSIHDAIKQCYEDGRAGAIDLEARADIAAETTAREALDTRVEALENDTTTAAEVTYDDTTTQLGATDVQGAIGALNNNLTDSVVPVDVTATFGSSAFTNKVAFCKKIGKMIFYNIRFTTGNATYPTSTSFALLNHPSSDLPADQQHASMVQNGFIMHGTSITFATARSVTSDIRTGIYSGETLQANEDVYAFGFIMLK